jgi:hypothetical protein
MLAVRCVLVALLLLEVAFKLVIKLFDVIDITLPNERHIRLR